MPKGIKGVRIFYFSCTELSEKGEQHARKAVLLLLLFSKGLPAKSISKVTSTAE
jgi:hypothetical protein